MSKIEVKGITAGIIKKKDYICITDIARYKDPERTDYIIQNWMRNRNTVELLGIWERLNNPDFNPIEFEGFKNDNALLINEGLRQGIRLERLNKIAIQQMKILTDDSNVKMLEGNI